MEFVGAVLIAAIVVGTIVMTWRLWKQGTRDALEFDKRERREQGLCEECGYDLTGGHDKCPECGTPVREADDDDEGDAGEVPLDALDARALRDDWPATEVTPRVPEFGEGPVAVHTTHNRFEADLLADQLEARGIRSSVAETESFEVAGAVSYNVVHLHVLVPSGDLEAARRVVERFRRRPSDGGTR